MPRTLASSQSRYPYRSALFSRSSFFDLMERVYSLPFIEENYSHEDEKRWFSEDSKVPQTVVVTFFKLHLFRKEVKMAPSSLFILLPTCCPAHMI